MVEQRLQALDNLPVGFVLVDSGGRVKYANRKSQCHFAALSAATAEPQTESQAKSGTKTGTQPQTEPVTEPLIHEVMKCSIVRTIKTGQVSFSATKDDRHDQVWLLELPSAHREEASLGVLLIIELAQLNFLTAASPDYRSTVQDLEIVMNLIGELVTITDDKGIVQRVNAACESVMGVKESEFVGQPADILAKRGIVDHSSTEDVLRTKNQTTVVQTTKSGRRLLVSAVPIYNDDGKLSKIVNISRDITEKEELVGKIEELRNRLRLFQAENIRFNRKSDDTLIMDSRTMRDISDMTSRVAEVDSTVLVLGETGVGKEVLARTIHNLSPRSQGPFISVNCGAIPSSLFEAELFGYAKGTFTGGNKDGKKGLVAAADGGTLFLDEIGELPLPMQAALLRVIQEKQVRPLGATNDVKVDVRFIAATNQNLEDMVVQKLFREDLYYRLNVVSITIPSLREHKEDILPLANYFLEMFNQKYSRNIRLHTEVIQAFTNYPWYGNIRELRNVIEKLVVTAPQTDVRSEELPPSMREFAEVNPMPSSQSLKDIVDEFERNILLRAMRECSTMREMSRVLGVDVSTISRKIKKHNLNPDFS